MIVYDEIPDNSGIAIEYNIPQTSKRVDFIVTGFNKEEKPNVIIIELKQWDKLNAVLGKDAMVETYTGNAVREVVHPSYQAWSYSMLIRDYNQSVQDNNIMLHPCAYLHNYRTLMARGMKGCYIYCEDAGLRDYLKERISNNE